MAGGFKLEQQHGKGRVRVSRVWRKAGEGGADVFVEWNVSISLLSDCLEAYTDGDNSSIVATDTIKNTVYAKAKECTEVESAESFAIRLAKHFTSFYPKVTTAIISIVEKPWEQVVVDGRPHVHGFKLGSEKHTTEVNLKKFDALRLISGIQGLSLLKTTQSGFEGFIRDRYTLLPETKERMLATEVTAFWRAKDSILTGFSSFIHGGTTVALVGESGSGKSPIISLIERSYDPQDGEMDLQNTPMIVQLGRGASIQLANTIINIGRFQFDSISAIPTKSDFFIERYRDVKKVIVDTFFGPPNSGVYSPSVQNTLYLMGAAVLNRFPDIASIQLRMPNIHFLPVNLSSKDNPNLVKFADDVYLPTDEPHGTIEATLSRPLSKL
ncbi:hypothetical protein IEQ34_002533 [Dendrobium chrysotoxum]|uniref:factor independent urate hydroxylase n=1 Tax=Dendrobium chrysotoxum TaxID=161865 RepID=A0AAV7HJZ4_DENCH|nr:hypothetical protein IEQ34_002533 [Dendrobium chrysotoxum]